MTYLPTLRRFFALSITSWTALFALAACGSGGGGDSSSSSAAPAPSTAARKVVLEVGSEECQYGGILVQTGIDDNRNGTLDDDEVDASEAVCNGAPGTDGTDGTATVIIYFELGQTFSLAEDAAAGDSAGTITAFTSNGTDVTFTEADSSSDAFDVSDTGEITLAAGVSLDFETQDSYTVYVKATADDAPDAFSNARIAVVDVDETPFQNGTAEHPYLVDSLAELQSIGSGFVNDYIATNCFKIINCDRGEISEAASLAANYRQVADIDASPTAAADYNSGAGFLPIGNCGGDACGSGDNDVPFTGSFDGGGYLIAGLSIDRSTIEGVGLFGLTGSGSVLENVAPVGVNIKGSSYSGALVGYVQGAVRQSFATGRLENLSFYAGGLIGQSTDTVENSFATVAIVASGGGGGLVAVAKGSVRRSFALGSVAITGGTAGGLIGETSSGEIVSHVFSTGSVSGDNLVGGLIGLNAGSTSDSYATGTATKGLVGNGTATRSYRVSGTDSATDATQISLANLRALACDAITEFRWDDPDDNPDGGPLDCAMAGAAAFPWDFGTSADLPVINGLVGGLDAEGQRRAVEFSLVDRAAVSETLTSGETSVDVTLTAPTVGREAGSVLSYFWVLQRSDDISADGLRAREVIITATAAGSYAAHLTIIERDAAGTLLAVYADEFSLTVN